MKFSVLAVILSLAITVFGINLHELMDKDALPKTLTEANARTIDTPSTGLISIETGVFEPFVWQNLQWRNHMLVVRPPSVQSRVAVIFITGNYGYSQEELAMFRLLALQNRAYVAILFDVPNQPLFNGKKEDWLVSYTFSKFLETGDPTWPALVPMVRSTITSMNLLEDYAARRGDKIEGFILTGGSKRGWTSWLTAAMDDRVEGIVPIAYDTLNLAEQMEHQLDFWGRFSQSIREYVENGILDDLVDPKKKELLQLVDPYTYRESLTIPKLIVVGTNDPYWPIDAANLYISGLLGYSAMVYAPNAGHGAEVYRVTQSITAMLGHLNTGLALPSVEATYIEDAEVTKIKATVYSRDAELIELRLFRASSSLRDFRKAFFDYRLIGENEEIIIDRDRFDAFYVEGLFKYNGKDLLVSSPARVLERH